MGKDWAKGLTVLTDPRIARNAAVRRGTRYHTKRGAIRGAIAWSPELAYAVGLTATDGCLSRDRRHITFDSKDLVLVDVYLRCIQREDVRIVTVRTRRGGRAYRAAFSDTTLYDWLFDLGIRPAKSLTLGGVTVPAAHFVHFVRGLLDGDGTVYVLRHRPTPKTYPNYWYVRLWTYFASGSRRHIDWLRREIRLWLGLNGYVERMVRQDRADFYRLKYGKIESRVLLAALYADLAWPALERKRRKWLTYEARVTMRKGNVRTARR
jgi:hypothetical protein